jgi:hypothetical protein
MPAKLSTTVGKIPLLSSQDDACLISEFHLFMKENGASERHQNNNLKAVISYARFLAAKGKSLRQVNTKEDVLSFLNTKVKVKDDDPEQKWITTYNDYLHRLKHFFRWLFNENRDLPMDTWKTPNFLSFLKPKKTKRLSPYSETEIWDKEEFLSIIKYEHFKRNKAALALMWDLDARNHEVTLLRIKNVRLKERYGEGEIPHESKTGTGPILLTLSFPYVRDWLNEHPFKNEPNARLICNLHNGAPIKPEALHTMMNQLKKRILKLLETGEIKDEEERERMMFIVANKKFNPYCIRHSAISSDSDFLPEYALKKKVRWSMNSKQGARYIKPRWGNELKDKILEHNGITSGEEKKKKPSVSNCPRCDWANVIENKYCSKCSYPLTPKAYEEIKQSEEDRFKKLEEKHNQDMSSFKKEMEMKLQSIIARIDLEKLKAVQ